jgi:hypothetical protein
LDPLILRPWEIAQLTDAQIQGLIADPATRRAERLDKERGLAGKPVPKNWKPDRMEFIAEMRKSGMPKAEAEAIYDKEYAR